MLILDIQKVTAFVVKVSHGSTARSGDGFVYHDGPTDAGIQIGTCALDGVDGDTTTCMTMIPTFVLNLKDSLSCFISTDGGSFEGGSCSVLADLSTADPI